MRATFRSLVALTAILLGSSVWVLGPTASAGAADPWVAGTYQINAQGISPFTEILLPGGAVAGGGTWFVQHRIVTIDMQGGEAPFQLCLESGQPVICFFQDSSSGPRTSTGIASPASPGTATAAVGGLVVFSAPFYAIRTGPAHVRKG
jgi:hypothetical protein